MRWMACIGFFAGFFSCMAQTALPQTQASGSSLTQNQSPDTSTQDEKGAQQNAPSSEEINSLFPKPQVIINVREHQFSPDMVTITLLATGYPQELLQNQLEALGSYTGSPPRGLNVYRETIPAKEPISFLKATFATDNIIDRVAGRLHIDRVIKPFLGAPEPHTLSSFLVTFEGEIPSSRTLRLFSTDKVLVSGTASVMPRGVEYKVLAKTQNPEELTIPTEGKAPEQPKAKPEQNLAPAMPLGALLLLVTSSLILGALVYFLSVRSAGKRKVQGRP